MTENLCDPQRLKYWLLCPLQIKYADTWPTTTPLVNQNPEKLLKNTAKIIEFYISIIIDSGICALTL